MANFEVTVIVVSYKSAALTVQALHSLFAERTAHGLPHAVVLVDNDSGDAPALEAAVQLAGYGAWAHVVRAPRNGGFGYGNNLGMSYALSRGAVRHFLLLNPDAVVRPQAVWRLAKFLDDHPHVGIVGSSFENEDGSDWPIAFRFPSAWSEFEGGVEWKLVTRLLRRHVVAVVMPALPARVDWVAGASLMIRADLACSLQGFDESYFLYFEETDLCLRARRSGFETWYVPASRVMHISGQSTKLTERNAAPKRMPSYWFESRRRYFQVNHGTLHAAIIDLSALCGLALGTVKRVLLQRRSTGSPRFVRDLARHSVLAGHLRALPFQGGLQQACEAIDSSRAHPG